MLKLLVSNDRRNFGETINRAPGFEKALETAAKRCNLNIEWTSPLLQFSELTDQEPPDIVLIRMNVGCNSSSLFFVNWLNQIDAWKKAGYSPVFVVYYHERHLTDKGLYKASGANYEFKIIPEGVFTEKGYHRKMVRDLIDVLRGNVQDTGEFSG